MLNSAMEATHNICRWIGQGVVSHATASRWFLRFDEKNFNLSDDDRSGRPTEVDDDELKDAVRTDPRQNTRCLASTFGCTHVTIANRLNRLGFRFLHTVWIPHTLTLDLATERADLCYNFIKKKRNFKWLDNLVTGDEKWVLYVNIMHKQQWLERGQLGIPTPKPDLHPKKVMLCVWWGVKGVLYWELLPTNTTVTAQVYTAQLEKLKARIVTEHPELDKIYFLHDNARPHTAKLTREKLDEFGWKVIPHPPYSPDLAPTDYHLFRSLSSKLRNKTFDDETHIKAYLTEFFDSKDEEFYREGIHSLAIRAQWVYDHDGQYYTD